MHEKQIEVRWRDFDAARHVNNAVYLNYIEEARDEWLDQVLGKAGMSSGWDFVLVAVAINFRRELVIGVDHRVTVTCRLERVGRSSVHTREEVRTATGEIAADAESVLVARDSATARSRPLSPDELAALDAAREPHNAGQA
jgi:YbgC/YbaW family acyl-CoA thioester hydrolase